ncbi:MAG: hypothetical protein ABEJ76_07350 [Halanaeroarchaeum sp.]
MGIFNDLGRRVESFKRQVEAASEETYECEDCGADFHAAYDECPECGSDSVVQIE